MAMDRVVGKSLRNRKVCACRHRSEQHFSQPEAKRRNLEKHNSSDRKRQFSMPETIIEAPPTTVAENVTTAPVMDFATTIDISGALPSIERSEPLPSEARQKPRAAEIFKFTAPRLCKDKKEGDGNRGALAAGGGAPER
jgi:hypothetical protein